MKNAFLTALAFTIVSTVTVPAFANTPAPGEKLEDISDCSEQWLSARNQDVVVMYSACADYACRIGQYNVEASFLFSGVKQCMAAKGFRYVGPEVVLGNVTDRQLDNGTFLDFFSFMSQNLNP